MSVTPAVAPAPEFPFSLEGSIPPRPVPLAYRIGLGLTAFAMILLPLAYVAIVAATGYGVWLYAHAGTAIFSGSGGGIWRLIIYLAPLVAGVILVAFMIKPLFARPARSADPLALDLDQQPQLRALIAAICRQVGAPMPVRVDLDCQVNASARLRRGLLSLGRRDLVLTIGLPLVGGLTARQFAGVLAHEFGHFAQGAGMAFTYIIRSINGWFARVVFERDEWDVNIHQWSQELDIRIGIIFWLARGGIWISRKILHGLMLVGHAIACLQLRQMEFDADYYESHVAGSGDFAATARELRRLGVANQAAFGELGELWNERKLVDDFPAFVGLRRAQLTREVTDQLDAAQLGEKTRWFDTHPSDLARCTHAKALKLAGNFRGDGPATALFNDFAELSRLTTKHFYREHLELNFDERALLSTTVAARTGEEASTADAARGRLVGTVLNLNRPLTWSEADFAPAAGQPSGEPGALAAELAALRAELKQHREAAESADKVFNTLTDERNNAETALAFLGAGVTIQPEGFGLSTTERGPINQRIDDLTKRRLDASLKVNPFERAADQWVRRIVAIARHPARPAPMPAELAARIDQTARALVDLGPWFRAFPEWLRDQNTLAVLAGNANTLSSNRAFEVLLNTRREKMRHVVDGAPALVSGAAWPLPVAGETITTATHLDRALHGVHGDGRILVLLRTAGTAYFRLIGQIAAQGEELERALTAVAPAPASG